MYSYLTGLIFCLNIQLFSAQESAYSTKEIQVYTTAKNTELRLTRTETLNFEPAKQPLETEVSVFVNPHKSYQSLLGIGGAITDASAVVFNGLSKAKQQELL